MSSSTDKVFDDCDRQSLSLVKMKPQQVPSYLIGGASLCHTNVVIYCEDNIQLKTSSVMLAAISNLMNGAISSTCCLDTSPATSCEDEIHICVENHSSNVLQVLRFIHQGCIYSSVQEPADLPKETIHAFHQFGIDFGNLKFSVEKTDFKDLVSHEEFVVEPRSLIKPDINQSEDHDFSEEIKVEDEQGDFFMEKMEEDDDKDFVPDENDSDYEPGIKFPKCVIDEPGREARKKRTNRIKSPKLSKHIQALDKHEKTQAKEIARPRGRPKGTKKDMSEKMYLPVADTLFYFPQAGEIDLTKRYQCTKCVRKFELEHDWLQHVRRHDSKSEADVFFCLKCDDVTFEYEKDYIEHKKLCEDDFEYKTVIGGDPHSQEKYYFHFPQNEDENELYPFKCKLCIRTFQMRKQFEQHIRRHVNNKQTLSEAYSCLTCNKKTFKNYKTWKDHETRCDERDNQLPENVWKVYEMHGLLDPVEKKLRKDPKTQYCCAPCGKVFNGKYKYRMHLEQMGPYHETCGSCDDFKISNMSEYQKHVDAVHGGVMMYRCSKCGESFSNVILVKHHKSKKHKGQKVNEKLKDFLRICEVCGKELKSPSGMYNHMMMFHGGKLLDCAQCGGTYRSEAHLKAHIKREHEKSYQCDQCGFSTKKSRAYEVHVLKEHTPNAERPFKCHFCPKGFFDRRVYEDHLNIHTGARPYACPHCSATFNSKGNYGAHIRQTHKGIKRKK